MRIQVPSLPQDRPTNPRNSLAGRWYATINSNKEENTSDNHDKDSQERDTSGEGDEEDDDDMKLPQRYGYRKQRERNSPNTLGDFVLHNHHVMNQFGLRNDDLPQGYQQQERNRRESQNQFIPEEVTTTPSISSTDDIVRAGMQRYHSQESGTSHQSPTPAAPSGLLSTEHPRSRDSTRIRSRQDVDNVNMNEVGTLTQTRRPRSRSPAPDVAFLRRYRQQNRERQAQAAWKQQQLEQEKKPEIQGWGQTQASQQQFSIPQHHIPIDPKHSPATPQHFPPQNSSSSDPKMPGSSSEQLRKTSTLSSGSHAMHQRQNSSNQQSSSSNSNSKMSNLPQPYPQEEETTFDQDLQRYTFDNAKWFPHSHSQDTAKVGNGSRERLLRNREAIANKTNEMGPYHDDPIDIERRQHAEEEQLWNPGNRMQIVQEAWGEPQRYENRTPPLPEPPSQNLPPEPRQAPPNFEEPEPVFQTRIDYFDDGIVLQPSAFDAVSPDGYRMFPNRALADANESLASTLPPVDYSYQHPYSYRPPPERSIKNIQCSPNPTPVSPMNQQSPSAAMTSLVEKGKSFFSLLGPSLIPRGCAPIGHLSEAIAAEEDDKVKRTQKSIWEFLDPNNDLSAYDDGSSLGSSERRSPRKHSSSRKKPSYDDENSYGKEDRYDREERYPTQIRSNARPSPHAFQEATVLEEVDEERLADQRQYRTKITVHQKNATSQNGQFGNQQTIYPGQLPSNESDPFDNENQDQEENHFVSDFEPFEESIHDAIWGSEESPDPIFSSSDPHIMRKKKGRSERHSTGRIGGNSPRDVDARRSSGPTPKSKQNFQRPKSAGRASRELGLSTKQNLLVDKNTAKWSMTRAQSTGRGSRVENFLQRLTGQNENHPDVDEKKTNQRRRSRNGSNQGGTPKHRRSIDGKKSDATGRRSRSGSNRDSQRSRSTMTSETSAWEGVDNFAHDLEKAEGMRVRSKSQDKRLQKKLDRVRVKSFRNAERLQSFDIDAARTQSSRSKRANSPRTPHKSQSPARERMSRRLESKFNDAASTLAAPWRENEDRNGHYMYVAYSRFDDDAQRVLQLCEHQTLPEPRSRNGEVMVRVEASTVSASDCAIRRGEWEKISLNPYIIPGVALIGRVHSDGRKQRRSNSSFSFSSPIQPGDMVMSLVSSGANARYVCLPKTQLVKVPPKLRLDEAVCLVETYLTAFQVLHLGYRGQSRYQEYSLDGRSILVLGGYSALGKALIELSIAGGAEYCYASACQPSDRTRKGGTAAAPSARRQFETLTKWGAIPLSSDPQDWLTLIGRQIDLLVTVYDPSEQAIYNEVVSDDHCKALRKDGQIVVICTHPGMNKEEEQEDVFVDLPRMGRHNHNPFRIPALRTNPRDKLFEERTVWYNVFDSWDRNKPDRHGHGGKTVAKRDLEYLLELLEQNRLHPEVLETIPLSKVGKAQFILENKRLAGHLVCAPWLKQQTAVLTPAMTGNGRG